MLCQAAEDSISLEESSCSHHLLHDRASCYPGFPLASVPSLRATTPRQTARSQTLFETSVSQRTLLRRLHPLTCNRARTSCRFAFKFASTYVQLSAAQPNHNPIPKIKKIMIMNSTAFIPTLSLCPSINYIQWLQFTFLPPCTCNFSSGICPLFTGLHIPWG